MKISVPPLGSATVGLAELKDSQIGAYNAGLVTVTAAGVEIASTGVFGVIAGDLVMVSANVRMDKGATGGANMLIIYDATSNNYLRNVGCSGTAGQLPTTIAYGVDPSTAWYRTLSGIYIAQTTGNVDLRLLGYSYGSNSSVNAGFALMSALRIAL